MLRPCLALVLLALYHTVHGELDTSSFSQQVNRLTNDVLGAAKFQEYLDNEVTFRSTVGSPEQVLDKLTVDLHRKVSERVAAVTEIQQVVEASFSSFDNTADYGDCCQCCSQNSDRSAYLKFHTENIDTINMCHTGQGTKSSSGRQYPPSAVNDVMKQNLAANPSLKWQYYGGEDGIMSIYPGNKMCNENFDPRYRPWYSHTAFPTPKDIVIVVDRSGSMATYHNDRKLLDIAKDAAETVIDTLSPDDRAAVVYFSSAAETIRYGCQKSELALMTPENKAILNQYVESGDAEGTTNYGKALERAFTYFSSSTDKPQNDHRERVKVILFLTDGAPTDSAYLDVISDRNRILGNKVVILTFGFGSSLDTDARSKLENIAKQTKNDASAGVTKPGRFVYVSNPDTLRYQMATYYDFFSSESTNNDVTVSIPYLDAFGLGLITSICLPVRASGTFRGVTCIDITLSDLFSDATFFSRGVESYAMVLDGQTRLLVHPLLPRPSDVYADPLILRVRDLEDEPRMEEIVRDYFLQGVPGSESFNSRRVLSRGDSEHEGVDKRQIMSTYMWKPLGLANLTVCVVLGNGDQQSVVNSPGTVTSLPYHRLDVMPPSFTCRYINRVARTDISTVKFSPFAFTSPDVYLETNETASLIQKYEKFFFGTDEAPFQDGVANALAISAQFDTVLDKSDTAWQSSVWRYLGLRDGVMRLFPGAKLAAEYDHTVRTWYKRATSQPTTITLSQPYVDAFGAGIVITLSKAVFESKAGGHTASDVTQGVLGMDFTMDLFNSYLSSYVTGCDTDKCFVVDSAGYVIAHPDFEGVQEKDIAQVENIHISQKEARIAQLLFDEQVMNKDGCINYGKKQVQTFWRISRSSVSGGEVEMNVVSGTNIFVVRVLSTPGGQECSCSVSQGATIPACRRSSCECPCYNRDDVEYEQCTSNFNFGELVYPPCAPPSPAVNLSSVAKEEEKVITGLEYCYPVEEVCPGMKKQLECSSTAGCIWCGKCKVRKTKGCDGDGVPIVAIVVPVVLIVVIIIAVIVYCKLKKKPKSRASAPAAAAATAPSGGHDNHAMSSELPDIRQQYAYNTKPSEPAKPDLHAKASPYMVDPAYAPVGPSYPPGPAAVAYPPPSGSATGHLVQNSEAYPHNPVEHPPVYHPPPPTNPQPPPAYADAFRDPVYTTQMSGPNV